MKTNTKQSKFDLKDLTLTLPGNAPILHNINLDILAGQVICLVGPSGSGKSTLLRCLNRLWEPPVGTVFMDGVDITILDVLALRRRVGMLFQSSALFDGTVADNVAYGPALQDKTISLARVESLLEMAGLSGDMASKSAGELSGGEAQRVALARAMANEPEALLLDEPTSSLDPAATRQVEETVMGLCQSLGLTVVWVSHSIEQVARIADKMALLVDGKLAETGRPEHLISSGHHLTEVFAAGHLGEKA